MFVVIPPLMIFRQPDQCQGQHTKKENPRWPIMVPPSISSSNLSISEIDMLSCQRLGMDNCIAYQLMHQHDHIPTKLEVEVAGVIRPT